MIFQGHIKSISEAEYFGQNNTKKRTVILEAEGNYPNSLAVDFINEKTDLLANIGVGMDVTIHINTKAREHNGRVYNSISGWKIETNNKD